MRPSWFPEEQIIRMLKEQEAGTKTTDACRKHGISAATFYKFKTKFGKIRPGAKLRELWRRQSQLQVLCDPRVWKFPSGRIQAGGEWFGPRVRSPRLCVWRRGQSARKAGILCPLPPGRAVLS